MLSEDAAERVGRGGRRGVMKRTFACGLAVWLGLLSGLGEARAQGTNLSMRATNNPSVVSLNQSFTTTMRLTNFGVLPLTNVVVANYFSAAVTLTSTQASTATFTNLGGVPTFTFTFLTNGVEARLVLGAQPQAAGMITNVVIASAYGMTNVTNILVVQAINGRSDLGVSFASVPKNVQAFDLISYAMAVTNAGPDTAPGVVLSTELPAGASLLATAPSEGVSQTSNTLYFALGEMTAGTSRRVEVRIQPTNAATVALAAAVLAPGVSDAVSANNALTNELTVGADLTGTLTATPVSPLVYNPQTGLMEQTVRLANVGTGAVHSARILLGGFTNQVYSAAGTNGLDPFVAYAGTLAPGASVDLKLEYFIPTRSTNEALPTFHSVEVPAMDLTFPLAGGAADTNLVITYLASSGRTNFFFEFPTMPGRSYTVLYSDRLPLTNAYAAQPALIAPANRLQWSDYGPPRTVAHPTNVTRRFYRVIETP
jgi:uncharacterized repeat protein (TIGR01451 family)